QMGKPHRTITNPRLPFRESIRGFPQKIRVEGRSRIGVKKQFKILLNDRFNFIVCLGHLENEDDENVDVVNGVKRFLVEITLDDSVVVIYVNGHFFTNYVIRGDPSSVDTIIVEGDEVVSSLSIYE
uniref:Galectin n=1 Tax=Parascaris univalens TaxID=6257 RepID=A0A915BTK6_PARUN